MFLSVTQCAAIVSIAFRLSPNLGKRVRQARTEKPKKLLESFPESYFGKFYAISNLHQKTDEVPRVF